MESGGIRATAARGLPKRSRTYPAERVCSHPGCITRLSVYNRSDRCYTHASSKAPRLRGRKAAA
jgi:hypothetical protein